MYQINQEKMFYDMADDQAIVINHRTGMYYGFSSLGSYVIDQLVAGAEAKSAAESIAKCDGCPADIAEKVDAFVRELLSLEILIKTDGEAAAAAAVPAAALEDGFDLTVDSYAEAAEMLFADPIHDVDENEGWPVSRS